MDLREGPISTWDEDDGLESEMWTHSACSSARQPGCSGGAQSTGALAAAARSSSRSLVHHVSSGSSTVHGLPLYRFLPLPLTLAEAATCLPRRGGPVPPDDDGFLRSTPRPMTSSGEPSGS